MISSQKLIDRLKVWEGFSSIAYKCAAGEVTIGYGHVINEELVRHLGSNIPAISLGNAESLLKLDLKGAQDAVSDLVTAELTQNRYDAIVSLIFNVGRGAFQRSLGLKLLNGGKDDRYELAAEQFFSQEVGFIYVNKVKNKGLINRRQAELRVWRDSIYD